METEESNVQPSGGSASAPLLGVLRPKRKWESSTCRWVWNSGYTCGLLYSLLFGASELLAKSMKGRVPALEVVAMRGLGALIILVPILRWMSNGPILGPRETWPMMALQALLFGITVALEYTSLYIIPVADTESISHVDGAVGAVLGWIFLSEPLGWKTIVGVVLCLVGVLGISRPKFLFGYKEAFDSVHILGMGLAMISAVTAAAMGIIIRRIGDKGESLSIVVWVSLGMIVCSGAPLAFGWPDRLVLNIGVTELAGLLGVIVTVLAGTIFIVRSIQLLHTAMALTIGNVTIIVVAVFGWLFLGEVLTLWEIVGSALIVAGILAMSGDSHVSRVSQ